MQKVLQYRNKVSVTQHGITARGRDIYFSSENTKKILCVVLAYQTFITSIIDVGTWPQVLSQREEVGGGGRKTFVSLHSRRPDKLPVRFDFRNLLPKDESVLSQFISDTIPIFQS